VFGNHFEMVSALKPSIYGAFFLHGNAPLGTLRRDCLKKSQMLQNEAILRQILWVASQFGVVESISVIFESRGRILDSIEQFLSSRELQNAIFGDIWIFMKYRIF